MTLITHFYENDTILLFAQLMMHNTGAESTELGLTEFGSDVHL